MPAKPRIRLEKVQSQHPKKNNRKNRLLGHIFQSSGIERVKAKEKLKLKKKKEKSNVKEIIINNDFYQKKKKKSSS